MTMKPNLSKLRGLSCGMLLCLLLAFQRPATAQIKSSYERSGGCGDC